MVVTSEALITKAISLAIYSGSCQLTVDFLKYGTISKFDRPDF